MNPKDFFLITRVFQLKVLKYLKMEDAHIRVADFLRAYVYDFGKNDFEIHSTLSEKVKFPPFEHSNYITKGIQDLSLGATSFPALCIIFKPSRDSEKFFRPATAFD